jgi:hypothetical protein
MNQMMRGLLIATGILAVIVGIGFFLQIPFFTQLWPWQLHPLSAVFLASIAGAIAAPVIWLGLKGETAAVAGGAINIIITAGGMGIFCLLLYFADNSRQGILTFGIAAIALALLAIGLFWMSRKAEFQDERPTPKVVRYGLVVFVLTLFVTGGALLLKVPNTFPWDISPEISVMYGWFFYGALGYFAYGFFIPKWSNAQGQLLSFLGYDLVLIVPYLLHFAVVDDEQRLSLIVYVTVLVTSAILAIYYLFIKKETRFAVAQA